MLLQAQTGVGVGQTIGSGLARKVNCSTCPSIIVSLDVSHEHDMTYRPEDPYPCPVGIVRPRTRWTKYLQRAIGERFRKRKADPLRRPALAPHDNAAFTIQTHLDHQAFPILITKRSPSQSSTESS